jgi:hypothetical protein
VRVLPAQSAEVQGRIGGSLCNHHHLTQGAKVTTLTASSDEARGGAGAPASKMFKSVLRGRDDA